MGTSGQPFTVRPDYVHALAGARQRFVGSILRLEPGAFGSAVQRLTSETPIAESTAEEIIAWSSLADTVVRGAAAHHCWFHRFFGATTCSFSSESMQAPATFARDFAFSSLRQWADTYVSCFEGEHSWPPSVTAASLLQAHVSEAWYIDELARAVGASSWTLQRSFLRVYGVTAQQYHSLLRVHLAATAIRARAGSIDGIALEIGWRSPKDIYRAFRLVTGITPASVQFLTDAQFSSLMQGALALPVPRSSARS